MGVIKFLFLTVVTVALVTFCVVNRATVTISLFPLPYYADIPVFIIAILSIAIGVVVASVTLNIKIIKMGCKIKKMQQRIDALENENRAIRSEREFTVPMLVNK